ncbi:MAG TPA: DUF4350 domain-containing protein [Anaerolineales bacterium]|nr:DUF4350 domain-containing protein [Anaerolineales bacterium]
MKSLSRDTKLAIGILVTLFIMTALAATQQRGEQQLPTLSSLSSAPNGALALKLWVKELQYKVDEQALENFIPPKDVSILFALEPLFPTESEMQPLDDWVEAGGTLIAMGDQYGMYLLLDHYQFTLRYLSEKSGVPASETPLLDSPAALDLQNAKVRAILQSKRDDFVVLAAYQGQPVLVSFEQGKGRVILGTVSESFTNAGLKQAGNPELVLNVLALARVRGTVWFDEWHHGARSGSQILGPAEFLRRTPVGRSLLFVAFTILIVFFIQGRGFGRPVPLPQEIKRRGAWEHVTGIANLSRRAAHRSAVMVQYHQQIKRKLGHRYRLDPGLDDKEYIDMLAGYNPSLQKDELLNLLKRLKRRDISEADMVHLAAEAAKWIDN